MSLTPHTDKTDTASRVTLPSKIAQVRWTRTTAAAGGSVGLEITTSFVGNGSDLQIELSDANGRKHGVFKQQIAGNRFWADIKVPEKAEKALIATAKLPKHGLEKTSPALFVRPPVKITNVKWSQSEARRGDILTLRADVTGAPDGAEARLSIWEHDQEGAHDLITSFSTTVHQDKVEAEWEFEYHEDTDDIPSDEDLEDGYRSPEYFFRVEIAGVSASSALLEFRDWIEIVLQDPFGEPFDGEPYVVYLPDGAKRNGTLDAQGRAREEDLPPGHCEVEFPDLGD